MIKNIRTCLNQLSEAKQTLRLLGVIRSERLTGEIGEYIAGELFGYGRARTTSNKGWDLQSKNGEKIQVKAHAKGPTNPFKITFIEDFDPFDFLVLVIMTSDYRIQAVYRIPKNEAEKRATIIPKHRRYELPWSRCEGFRITPENHPHSIWGEIGVV